jgi:hypothetical protein
MAEESKTKSDDASSINPEELIEDVSKNIELLKKYVGYNAIKPKKPKKERKPKSEEEKSKRIPKYAYLKHNTIYLNKVNDSEKINLKDYLFQYIFN